MVRMTVSQPVCLGVKHPYGAYDQIFITVRHLRFCSCGAFCLTRERFCRLQLLLVLASVVILGSEFHGTRDHILLSHIQGSPNLGGQVPVFIYPRTRVAQLYPQALGSVSTASVKSKSKSKLCYDRRFSRPVCLGINHPSGAPAAGSLCIVSVRTAHKTSLPTVTPLLRVTQPLPSKGCLVASQFLLWTNMPHSIDHL
jgi:hypothetical protein